MVFLEDLRRALQIERFLRPLVPRQLGNGFEISANHLRFHRFAAGALEARELAIDHCSSGFRQIQRVEPLLEIVGFRRLLFLAELLANCLHLFAEQHFALALAELFLYLRLDVLLHVEHTDLPLHVHQHTAQPIFDRERFQQRLALRRRNVVVKSRLEGSHERNLRQLVRQQPDRSHIRRIVRRGHVVKGFHRLQHSFVHPLHAADAGHGILGGHDDRLLDVLGRGTWPADRDEHNREADRGEAVHAQARESLLAHEDQRQEDHDRGQRAPDRLPGQSHGVTPRVARRGRRTSQVPVAPRLVRAVLAPL